MMDNMEGLNTATRTENIEKPKKRCLLIDNYSPIIVTLRLLSRRFPNFKAVECHSEEEALKAIIDNMPDILFLDHNLSRSGGEGLKIADKAKEMFPGMEIFSTTYRPDHALTMEYRNRGINHIDKGNVGSLERVIKGE